MDQKHRSLSVTELEQLLGADVKGTAPADSFTGIAPLDAAGPQEISFLANPRYRELALASRAGAILCSADDAGFLGGRDGRLLVVTKNPYASFARVSQFFFSPEHHFQGQSPQAHVDQSAQVHPSAILFPNVFIGPGARVDENCVLYPGVFVGAGSRIGRGCILYPNSVVREGCILGESCILNPGAVVGGDGFGFAPDGRENVKIPQIGGVVLGDHVEIGSNASVDRGTVSDTVVGAQTKIDSLVQVGHNVRTGESCFVAALTAIGGSTELGTRVTVGGHVAITGHAKIASGVTLLGACAVSKSLSEAGLYNGIPAVPNREYLKREATLRRLVAEYKKGGSSQAQNPEA